VAQIDPEDLPNVWKELPGGGRELRYLEDLLTDKTLPARQKALDAELRTFVLGFAVVVAMAAVAAWWVWCAHDAELVDAKAKVDQMARRLMDADLNARDLRAMYRLKLRGKP